jgi:hypothetical protein
MRSFLLFIFLSNTAYSRIEFQTKQLDFGTIWRGNQVEQTVQFVNRGPSYLKIMGIDAGCGCIAVERELNKIYAPGQTGSLLVRFDSSDYQGQIRRQIGVFDGSGKIQTLFVNTNIRESLHVSPPLIDFANEDKASPLKRLVLFKSFGSSKVKILSVSNPLSFIQTEVMNDGSSMEVLLLSEVPRDRNFGLLLVRTTDPNLPEVKIPVLFKKAKDSIFGKRYLEFGTIARGETVLRRLSTSNENSKSFTLKPTRLQLNGKDLSLEGVKVSSEGDGFSISISHQPGQSGAFSGALNLTSDEGVEINVDYFGFFL